MFFYQKLKNSITLKKIGILLLFFILSYLYIAIPLYKGVIYHGPDRMFHLERLEEAYQALKNGNIVSMISTYSSSRVGQAINIFYPWINLIPYGIIRILVFKPITAYYLFMMLEQFLGLLIAYLCSLKLIKNQKSSILFAILYRFSVYILINDFARVDIGEAWATVFLPIVFLGSYTIFSANRKGSYIQGSIFLALGLIFITYCHILTAVITVGILAVVYVVSFYFQQNKLNKLCAFFVSACMYFLGGLIILFPIIDTMCKLKIVTPNPEYFTNYNFTFNVLFDKSLENVLDFDNPNIGIVVVALINITIF